MSNVLLTDLADCPIIAAQGEKFLFCPREYAKYFYLLPRIWVDRPSKTAYRGFGDPPKQKFKLYPLLGKRPISLAGCCRRQLIKLYKN
jgi:hypothetical protein